MLLFRESAGGFSVGNVGLEVPLVSGHNGRCLQMRWDGCVSWKGGKTSLWWQTVGGAGKGKGSFSILRTLLWLLRAEDEETVGQL